MWYFRRPFVAATLRLLTHGSCGASFSLLQWRVASSASSSWPISPSTRESVWRGTLAGADRAWREPEPGLMAPAAADTRRSSCARGSQGSRWVGLNEERGRHGRVTMAATRLVQRLALVVLLAQPMLRLLQLYFSDCHMRGLSHALVHTVRPAAPRTTRSGAGTATRSQVRHATVGSRLVAPGPFRALWAPQLIKLNNESMRAHTRSAVCEHVAMPLLCVWVHRHVRRGGGERGELCHA